MDRKALFDAVRPYAPGGKLKPEWVPMIDALADAMGLPRAAGGPGDPDPELIAALKKDEGLRLTAYPDPLSPRAKTGMGSGAPWTIGYGRARGIQEGQRITAATAEAWLIEDAREHNAVIHAALPWLKRLDPVRRRVVENMHFNMGWDDPKTPQREAMVYICLPFSASALSPGASVESSEAIWSMKEPVPPAQTPFMRCSGAVPK